MGEVVERPYRKPSMQFGPPGEDGPWEGYVATADWLKPGMQLPKRPNPAARKAAAAQAQPDISSAQMAEMSVDDPGGDR